MSPRHGIPHRTGATGLARRQFAADPWVSLGLALLVGTVALLLTAVPRGLVDVQSRQLVQEIGSLSAAQRDLRGDWQRTVVFGSTQDLTGDPSADGWAPLVEGAERVRAEQPEPLRSTLGPAQFLVRLTDTVDYAPPVESGYYAATLSLAVDPDLTEHVDLVTGDWPELVVDPPVFGPDAPQQEQDDPEPVPVVLLDEAADELLLEVGDEVQGLVVAGTYTPTEPDDPRWQHVDNGATLGTLYDPNLGESAYATAFLSPDNRGSIGQPASVRMRMWFPVQPGAITGSTGQVEALRAQVNGFLAEQHTLATADEIGDAGAAQVPLFTTDLTEALGRIVSQQRATSSLLAVVAAGPLGVALAVAALGARLVVHRRRQALAMTLARGASPGQLRRLIAGEGLLLGVPAAALGHLGATLLVPGPTPWWQWLVTAVVALVPSVALAASVDDASLQQRRSDLSSRSASRWRWVVELAVVGLAGVATWRLLDRGARGDGAGQSGIDLLAAGTPVLLALAACVLTLRLYPLPLRALAAALRGRPSLTPFLGASRALRDPAGGLVPALAVVLGTAIALVSAVLLSTVTRGAEVAAWEANGAAVRLNGPLLSDELRAEIEQIDGVVAVGGVADTGATRDLVVDGERQAIRVWAAEPQVQEVYARSAPVPPLPDEFWRDEGIPAVVTLLGADEMIPDDATEVQVSRLGEIEVVGHRDQVPGILVTGAGVLVDGERWVAAGGSMPDVTTTLVGVADGASPQAVADDVTELVGTGGVVTTVTTRLEAFEDAPVTTGLRQLFVGATVVSALLTVLAVVVVQLMGSTARTALLATLRTLGLGARQTRALTAWELAPLLVTSLLVGTLLGLGVPWVLLRGLDLTGLTGGSAQPALSLDLPLLAAVLGAVVLTVLIAVTVSAWIAGRTNLAQALRVGEDR
ncbi:putative membrane protein [Serinicoccus hydrothermalis]|uniref:Putative membrane protein n=1 Tax=Serinicoccus hydrothermalis TaxID=1758689 RepID=A0A1B1NC50_9MICO|nr:FtsX-like permease family protein [Serinicoccus hydrothermalis]ANS79030.1 putative membrane protein [Serinicoccus hydrothermalis]